MFISAPAASRAPHADKKVSATRHSLFSPDFANLVTGLHHFVARLTVECFRKLRHVHQGTCGSEPRQWMRIDSSHHAFVFRPRNRAPDAREGKEEPLFGGEA